MLVSLSTNGFGMKEIHREYSWEMQETDMGSHLIAGFEFMLERQSWWIIGNEKPGSPHPGSKV